ncbi:isoleucine--tRNA ligase [candidate division CSSED10-310 bacterium]|uniref:Isoleucine--tRNA ligase n=1 Tax=candidate division CSSED10-310 bacterium TaxID=2855610 RepID=A0ABV6Z4R5_UNCC1
MMYQKVETWVDLIQLEHTILDFWQRKSTFDKLRQKNAGKEPWSFLDGPITANNPMGVHHAWGRTMKDVFQRYYAMNGRDLRYQNGFDCQGLWVEVEVEKELGFKSKKDIEQFGINQFVEKCRQRVLKYSQIQTDESIRLGYWMDWNNSYFTMSDENNYTIWKFLKKCHERGLIYKGHDVMPWCTRCSTGISQHEMHEGYEEVSHTSVVVKFPLRNRTREALLVWTTTLWTLTSNIAAAVNPDLEYVKVRQGDWIYYLADLCAERVLPAQGPHEVLGYLKGKDLVGLFYDGPFDELPVQVNSGLAHPVVPWEMVSATEGTGIVHIAPGCGKEDNELGKELGLALIAPIDELGIFMADFDWISGKNAMNVAPQILADMKSKNILYSHEEYSHSYPHCWRCGTELLFRFVDEWFIAMNPWRDEIKEVAKKIHWLPAYGLDLELDWLTNMRDWMISKKRYWGLSLPIWECGNCFHFEVIGSREELKRKAEQGWDVFEGHSPHRSWIDEVKIKCEKCGHIVSRIADVGNPWLDAGIVPYSTVNYNHDQEYWQKWIPADLVLECFPGQFRNWFYSLLAMSTMMENIPPFKTLLGHALVRDEKGEEMHKSLGTAIWFQEAVEEMGADVMRWIFCHQETTINLNFGYTAAKEVRGKFMNTFWNIYGFFVNYARIINFTPPASPTPLQDRSDFDRWILSNLQLTIQKVRQYLEEYSIRTAVRSIDTFIENLSNWYIRHCRRRFWRGDNDADARLAYETLYECLITITKLLAPFIPFITEEIYQNLVRSHDTAAPESVHLTDFPTVNYDWIDNQLSADMDTIIHLNWLALSAREKAHLKVRQPLAELRIGPSLESDVQAVTRFKVMLQDDLNVKNITIHPLNTPNPCRFVVKPNYKTLGKQLGPRLKALTSFLEENSEEIGQKMQQGADSITVTLAGARVPLNASDLKLEMIQPEHLSVAQDKGVWVAFDTRLTEELRLEGMMRDLLRRLQVLRKEVGLEIEDTISLTYTTISDDFRRIMNEWQEFLSAELLCTQISEDDQIKEYKSINLGGHEIHVTIRKSGKL